MKNAEAKRRWSAIRNGNWCPIAFKSYLVSYPCNEHIGEWHHAGIADTKNNRRQFPLYIDSIWNGVLVSKKYHEENRSWGRHSYQKAERREAFLRKHPMIAEWVNNPGSEK